MAYRKWMYIMYFWKRPEIYNIRREELSGISEFYCVLKIYILLLYYALAVFLISPPPHLLSCFRSKSHVCDRRIYPRFLIDHLTGITNRVLGTSPVFILSYPLVEIKIKATFFIERLRRGK